MASVSITIPDVVVGRVLNAFDGSYPNRPTSTTKAQWAQQMIVRYVRDVTIAYEREQAAIAAAAAAAASADQEISIT